MEVPEILLFPSNFYVLATGVINSAFVPTIRILRVKMAFWNVLCFVCHWLGVFVYNKSQIIFIKTQY